eukprot:CAMPEP_0116909786 /NCGR_PEP_ID=MMETSP0467-20121206/14483_1 /TAXON_ID=283647 /ORGANISM="Mesodinium pulex, Strain SPMC105" /LENGTH=224 /DNA_ID=CAMNT_0004585211 /DNA_START=260 /DNA_END=933 /DNA_ORIENTATION=+
MATQTPETKRGVKVSPIKKSAPMVVTIAVTLLVMLVVKAAVVDCAHELGDHQQVGADAEDHEQHPEGPVADLGVLAEGLEAAGEQTHDQCDWDDHEGLLLVHLERVDLVALVVAELVGDLELERKHRHRGNGHDDADNRGVHVTPRTQHCTDQDGQNAQHAQRLLSAFVDAHVDEQHKQRLQSAQHVEQRHRQLAQGPERHAHVKQHQNRQNPDLLELAEVPQI